MIVHFLGEVFDSLTIPFSFFNKVLQLLFPGQITNFCTKFPNSLLINNELIVAEDAANVEEGTHQRVLRKVEIELTLERPCLIQMVLGDHSTLVELRAKLCLESINQFIIQRIVELFTLDRQ